MTAIKKPQIATGILNSFFGADDNRAKRLPGTSPETYIGFDADIPKRDAIVEAFKVRSVFICSDINPDDASSMLGTRMVRVLCQRLFSHRI